MNLHALKRRLLVLICICTISAACSQVVPTVTPVKNNDFSADYYLLKRPIPEDYLKLDEYSHDADQQAAASASLILGFYHLRDGNLALAKPLITANYRNPALDAYMTSLGELWMMELSISEANYDIAQMWADSIEGQAQQAGMAKALNAYCSITQRYPRQGAGPYDCVRLRLEEAGIGVEAPVAEPEPAPIIPEEPLEPIPVPLEPIEPPLLPLPEVTPDPSGLTEYSGTLQILVTGSGNMFDRAGGMYYFLRIKGLDHKIRVSKEYIVGEWDFWLDLDTGALQGKGFNIAFLPNIDETILKVPLYVNFNSCENMILAVPGRKRHVGNYVLDPFRLDAKRFTQVMDIAGGNVARAVRDSVQTILEKPFCAIAVGAEKDINNFIPTARQYITRNTQNIYYFVDANTGGTYGSQYRQYYLNSYLFTEIDLSASREATAFASAYRDFTGKDTTLDTVIGYDMLNFIHKMSREGQTDYEPLPYATGIKAISDGQILRDMKAFYVNSIGQVEPLDLLYINYATPEETATEEVIDENDTAIE